MRELRYFYHVIILPRFGSVELSQSVVISMKSLVTVTLLLFSVSSHPKVTGVPSPTISMVQRTALRFSVNSLLKQVTSICLRVRQVSGLFT